MNGDDTLRFRTVAGLGSWSPEASSRLWWYINRSEGGREQYFSRRMRRGIVELLRACGVDLDGAEILDFGCGPGYLIEALLAAGGWCRGLDLSSGAVAEASTRNRDHPRFRGAIHAAAAGLQLPPGSIDVVTCIETIEHLEDRELDEVLTTILELLRPGGVVLVTTPNDEDLAAAATFCPFCATEFHPMQHVRSFSAEALERTLGDRGYDVAGCFPTNLEWFQMDNPESLLDWSPRLFVSRLREWILRWLDRIAPRPFPHGRVLRRRMGHGPHLVAVARRPSDPGRQLGKSIGT